MKPPYRKMDYITKDHVIELIESRLYTDGQIAKRLGIDQPLVSYYRRKLGLPPITQKESLVAIKLKIPATPVAKYFDEALGVWVSVYKAMLANGARIAKTAAFKDWRGML